MTFSTCCATHFLDTGIQMMSKKDDMASMSFEVSHPVIPSEVQHRYAQLLKLDAPALIGELGRPS